MSTTGTISIEGLGRADVLAALYNSAHPQGLGFLHYSPEDMTHDEAAALLDAGHTYFDYVKGRVMKINLGAGDELRVDLYDRDNGVGAAARALAPLRSSQQSEV